MAENLLTKINLGGTELTITDSKAQAEIAGLKNKKYSYSNLSDKPTISYDSSSKCLTFNGFN